MRKFIGLILAIAIALLSACYSPTNASGATLVARVRVEGDQYIFTLRNTSSKPIEVPSIIFSSPELSGHRLYIYDPDTKSIQEAFASTFRIGKPDADSIPTEILLPGQEIKSSFSKAYIEGFFFVVPTCYYVVYIFKFRSKSRKIDSEPSKPLFVCGK